MSVIKFDEVVEQSRTAAYMLDGEDVSLEQALRDYAPSIIGKGSGSVTLMVRSDDSNWTDELANLVRGQIAAFTEQDGERCMLTVIHSEDESADTE